MVVAVVAFALGVMANTALGWETDKNQDRSQKTEENKGGDHDNDKNKGHENENNKGDDDNENKGENEEKGKPVTPNVTPPTPQPVTPTVTPPTPAAPAPGPAPVVSQGPPSAPTGSGEGKPPAQLAQEGAPEAPPLAPVAEREELAKTGLDPVLMAVLGMFCLAGGGFLFRRAFSR